MLASRPDREAEADRVTCGLLLEESHAEPGRHADGRAHKCFVVREDDTDSL